VKRKGSTWSLHQKNGRNESILIELAKIWLVEKRNRKAAVGCT